jgi:lipoprotein-releasing system ATP-binding protein
MSQATQPAATRTIAPTREPILRARGAQRSFKMGDSTVCVLNGVDLTVRDGEFIAIEGRSGSGKSTLLHALGALDTLDAGSIEYEGNDYTARTPPRWTVRRLFFPRILTDWLRTLLVAMFLLAILALVCAICVRIHSAFAFGLLASIGLWVLCLVAVIALLIGQDILERPRAKLRNQTFGFVFQFYHLLPELTVLENTLLAPDIRGRILGNAPPRAQSRARATELLKQLGLDHRLKHRPNQLSGGERQRVAIARALMNNPRVLFADEPTGNLDAETGRQIMSVLEKLHRDSGQTIIMVTHDRTLARQADRVLVLKDGKLDKADS